MQNMSSQSALDSASEPNRRQNSSCDPCRRSKRRCFFSSHAFDDSSTSCAHCTRLGHACTFNFAASRLNSRLRKRQRQTRSDVRSEQSPTHHNQIQSGSPLGTNRDSESCASVSASTGALDDFASWLNFDIDDYLANDLHSTIAIEPAALNSNISPSPQNEQRLPLVSMGSQAMQHTFPFQREFVPGSSPHSPIHLLNSGLNANILDGRLIKIYEAILTGSAARFLNYETNLFATGVRYQIQGNNPQNSHGPRPGGKRPLPAIEFGPTISNLDLSGSLVPLTDTSASVQSRSYNMTVVGCARFLDHFADLYGNRLSKSSKMKSDRALKAALRVFALQWLPIVDSEEARMTAFNDTSIANLHEESQHRKGFYQVYKDAWHQARSAINEASSVRSFRVVFATFLFDGTVSPMSALNASNGHRIEHEFLDTGLDKLQQLDTLVQEYCVNLGSSSHYAALAEASLSLIRWSGYIRDTGAALTSNHQCHLHDTAWNANGKFSTRKSLWKDHHSKYSQHSILIIRFHRHFLRMI